ncbi:DUF397 domain-containing protein [Streptomyces sp. SD15]
MNVEESRQAAPKLAWFKSSYSTGSGGECVEVAACPGSTYVRDSKDKAGPVLSFTTGGWTAFIEFATQN